MGNIRAIQMAGILTMGKPPFDNERARRLRASFESLDHKFNMIVSDDRATVHRMTYDTPHRRLWNIMHATDFIIM